MTTTAPTAATTNTAEAAAAATCAGGAGDAVSTTAGPGGQQSQAGEGDGAEVEVFARTSVTMPRTAAAGGKKPMAAARAAVAVMDKIRDEELTKDGGGGWGGSSSRRGGAKTTRDAMVGAVNLLLLQTNIILYMLLRATLAVRTKKKTCQMNGVLRKKKLESRVTFVFLEIYCSFIGRGPKNVQRMSRFGGAVRALDRKVRTVLKSHGAKINTCTSYMFFAIIGYTYVEKDGHVPCRFCSLVHIRAAARI